ncbi:MAG TPA: cell division protein ZipA C-terminal FtsZ-binding domain-containing protein [Gallionella sp.]|nr:cell division protein ZipA C-terminal FtsZ-binding domain-containing protein [Gallionella sp.]
MSELQAALLAIGFGMIVAVYVFGWWQQRKYRRKFGAAFKSGHADALYQEGAARPAELADEPEVLPVVEPVTEHCLRIETEEATGPVSAESVAIEAEVAADIETAVSDEGAAEEAPVAEQVVAEPAQDESCALLDASGDFIIELRLAEPSPASVLDGLWQRKFDFGKPVQVCGLTLNAPRWERAIAEGQTLYARFRIALQLVDRGGAITATKLADFRDLVQGVARNIKADVSVPDVPQTHQCAVELDAFCAEVDQMVGVNLVVPGERLLSGSRIAEAASLQGMTLEADGAFHLLGAQGHSLFSLINQDNQPFQHHTLATHTTRGLTLLLDVPRVEMPTSQFDRMLDVAHGLARELQVNLVDDHRVVLSEAGLSRIREQIAVVEAKMCGNGIAPGSAQARRLFS